MGIVLSKELNDVFINVDRTSDLVMGIKQGLDDKVVNIIYVLIMISKWVV